ncbi:hypothetical protein BOTBODRAFT_28325 [Botryobasidium botryosum FD-172 SS1]|uniref:Linoleate 8R-lipoxygenase n=1 Tax=Botryobasidium botryosum (strain FD-172 SS1) TaxID=930990 RepID=A0A067MTC8_BOTB1|nr:hypothetical protein BOTBODRAFT_28325 [Botryobasidium botryosum FD-172 SS1]
MNPITLVYNTLGGALGRTASAADSIKRSELSVPTSIADEAHEERAHSAAYTVLQNLSSQIKRGLPIDLDVSTFRAITDGLRNTNSIDDRKFLLEKVLVLLSRLPRDSAMGTKLQNSVVALLWRDLPHPPSTFVSEEYAYRTADGSNNNVRDPNLGKSGTPYARSVQQVHPLPANQMPDPGLIFDSLMKRDKFVEHPAGLSNLFFAFATTVIHNCFRTNLRDPTINDSSSYVDLSPLYGNNEEELNRVRNKDGRGKLHEDVFNEDRLLLMPAAISVLLIIFCRMHNFIADKLLLINERGQWSDPPPTDQAALEKQENQIFQTARLINCGFYVSVVLGDYLSNILGLVRDGSNFGLENIIKEIREENHDFLERASGNACSVEFNLLYRWHSTTSAEDETWTNDLFGELFDKKPWDQINTRDFVQAFGRLQAANGTDPRQWNVHNLQRGPDGRYRDEDLAKILQDSTARPAGAFKARGIPEAMRIIEVMGIGQARQWSVSSLNEFRKFLGLKPFNNFTEWNSDPEIASTAEKLYGDIENLELYPGLVAEEPKPVMPGAGLCPGFTASRAILADAIALTRGDRHLTVDLTPHNLTAWGMKFCSRDVEPDHPSFGGILGKILLTTLPHHYAPDSVYTQFPLMTPKAMKKNLTNLGIADKYDFTKPVSPNPVKSVKAYVEVKGVLDDSRAYRTPYGEKIRSIMQGHGYLLSLDEPSLNNRDRQLIRDAVVPAGSLEAIADYFFVKTQELIKEKSYTLIGKGTSVVNIVRDVFNLVPLHWASYEVAGIPLKSKDEPRGSILEQELYGMLKCLYTYIFMDMHPDTKLRQRDQSKRHVRELLGHIKRTLSTARGSSLPFGDLAMSVMEMFRNEKKAAVKVMQKLHLSGRDEAELANNVLSAVILSTVEYSQGLTNVLNMYLDPKNAEHLERIKQLSQTESVDGDRVLEGYVREALRLDPAIPSLHRIAQTSSTIGVASVQKETKVYCSLDKAYKDHTVFADPHNIDPTRPIDLYSIVGDGGLKCLGAEFVYKTMAQVLKAVFSHQNVRPAPGLSGKLQRFAEDIHDTTHYFYVNTDQEITPWATSMTLLFDTSA